MPRLEPGLARQPIEPQVCDAPRRRLVGRQHIGVELLQLLIGAFFSFGRRPCCGVLALGGLACGSRGGSPLLGAADLSRERVHGGGIQHDIGREQHQQRNNHPPLLGNDALQWDHRNAPRRGRVRGPL
jgi:hypothetical protein